MTPPSVVATGPYVIGCDVGSQGTNCALYAADGTLVASSYQTYDLSFPFPGAAEQDPDAWPHATAAGVRELLEVPLRRVHHQVAVQHEVRAGTQRGHDDAAQRDRRDEMTIHDVDVDDVGIGLHELDLVGQMGEVGREDGRRQLPHGGGF